MVVLGCGLCVWCTEKGKERRNSAQIEDCQTESVCVCVKARVCCNKTLVCLEEKGQEKGAGGGGGGSEGAIIIGDSQIEHIHNHRIQQSVQDRREEKEEEQQQVIGNSILQRVSVDVFLVCQQENPITGVGVGVVEREENRLFCTAVFKLYDGGEKVSRAVEWVCVW